MTHLWLNTAQASERTGYHVDTIRKAAESAALHGHQRTTPNGRWKFRPSCLDAWVAGEACEHQSEAA